MNTIKQTIDQKGGFSINGQGNNPTGGYMVAIADSEFIIDYDKLTGNDALRLMSQYMDKLRNSADLYFGGWLNDDKVYFDLSENILDHDTALNVGKARQQIAIYDIVADTSIYL